MKTQLAIIGLILLLGSSCTKEAANFGKSDCYWNIKNELDQWDMENLADIMNYEDEDGNRSSYKVCLHRREYTEEYLGKLKSKKSLIIRDYCHELTGEEILELDAEVTNKIIDLEKALDLEEGVYDCENMYNNK